MQDLMALGLIVLVTLVVGAIFWRYPVQQWMERRLPLLFPSGMARNLESIALSRPVNHIVIHVLLLLGGFALVGDISGVELSAFLRYSVAVLVAIFSLAMARRSAAQRAELLPT